MYFGGFIGRIGLVSRERMPNAGCMAWTGPVAKNDMDTAQVRWIIGDGVTLSDGQIGRIIRGIPHAVDPKALAGQPGGIPWKGLDIQLLRVHRHQPRGHLQPYLCRRLAADKPPAVQI